jgi:LCP family protein required for cell wall assembly
MILLRAALILLITGAALFVLLRMTDRSWSDRYRLQETRETGNQAFMDEGIVEWNGNRYRKKPALTLILLAGIDKDGTEAPSPRVNYRNGGQADFLMLLAIDHGEKQVHQLQIDRDTMAEVTILGVYGNETGTRELQICLAHSFGARTEDNARYTVRAVRKLLNDLEIDGYYMVDYSAVPVLTDLLDGVPVTIPEDMTAVHHEWYRGHTVTLTGTDAETFVRTRKTVGSGTNAERMERQSVYMRGVVDRIHQKLSDDAHFASDLVSAFRSIAVTDLTDQRLMEEIGEARSYEVMPVDRLPGHYEQDSNGFVEFYPDQDSPAEWIMNHLYRVRQDSSNSAN